MSFIKSILYLLVVIFVLRMGSFVSVPYIDQGLFLAEFGSVNSSILEFSNAISGGSISRLSVMSLGITPYIFGSIMVMVMQFSDPKIAKISSGPGGAVKMEKVKRLFTLAIVLMQSFVLAFLISGTGFSVAVGAPSVVHLFLSFFVFFGFGTFVSIMIARSVDFLGLGSGLAFVIGVNILSSLAGTITSIKSSFSSGLLTGVDITMLLILSFMLVYVIYSVESSFRRLPLLRKDRGQSRKLILDLMVNQVGVMPVIFTSIVMMPLSVLGVSPIANPLLYYLVFSGFVAVFTYFMFLKVMSPDSLVKKIGDSELSVSGLNGEEEVTLYLKKLSRVMIVFTIAYLVGISLFPYLVFTILGMDLHIAGTSALILTSLFLGILQKSPLGAYK